MRLAAVVLAAGKSQRMGVNKLLLNVAGRPILGMLLEALGASPVEEIIVVLGHRAEELRPVVESHGVRIILNLDYEEGMSSSFGAGLRHVSADAAFLVLGDQLGLRPELLWRMAAAMESDPNALIVSPVHQGKRGHPVLFRSALFGEILGLAGAETIKDIVLRYENAHRYVDGDMWCVTDVDTPEEFERAKRLFEAGRASS